MCFPSVSLFSKDLPSRFPENILKLPSAFDFTLIRSPQPFHLKAFLPSRLGKDFLSRKPKIAGSALRACTGILVTTVFMRRPDHNLTVAAGHAVIAAALGLSLLVMSGLLMAGHF
jgi:hypothetical protein